MKVLVTVTEEENQVIINSFARMRAIDSTIRHLVDQKANLMQEVQEWWESICQKYGISPEPGLSHDPCNGEIFEK